MKKLLILLFSLLISFNSYGDWTYMGDNFSGDSFYLEKSKLKEHNGYAYFWVMSDYLEPTETGRMSNKTYFQGECEIYRVKTLSYIFYNEPMGNGDGDTTNEKSEWLYPDPDSIMGYFLEEVCDYVK